VFGIGIWRNSRDEEMKVIVDKEVFNTNSINQVEVYVETRGFQVGTNGNALRRIWRPGRRFNLGYII
jgi:hypothetical protein